VRVSDFSRCALSSCVAAALLAGCGGSQPPIGAPDAMAQSRTITPHGDRSGSWMQPWAKSGDLIYATGGCGGTCVVSYPAGEIVGSLNVGYGLNSGVCTDNQGNVYVSDSNAVLEYAHGGTTPVATFDLPGDEAAGCSIDPTTENLAVMFDDGVAIFAPGSQTPKVYTPYVDGFSCAYDPSGNLFVGGLAGQEAALAELKKDGSAFVALTIKSVKPVWGAGQVQWYGSYLSYSSAFGDEPFIYRLRISETEASVIETTRLDSTKWMWYPWIYQGKILVAWVPQHGRHRNDPGGVDAHVLAIWQYPRGGKPIRKITGFGSADLQSVTVSVAPSR
jgi:hypothetical protein